MIYCRKYYILIFSRRKLRKGDKFHVSNLNVGDSWYYGTPDPATNLAQYYYPSEIRGYAKAIYFNVY